MANLVINNQTFDLQCFVINSMKFLMKIDAIYKVLEYVAE